MKESCPQGPAWGPQREVGGRLKEAGLAQDGLG